MILHIRSVSTDYADPMSSPVRKTCPHLPGADSPLADRPGSEYSQPHIASSPGCGGGGLVGMRVPWDAAGLGSLVPGWEPQGMERSEIRHKSLNTEKPRASKQKACFCLQGLSTPQTGMLPGKSPGQLLHSTASSDHTCLGRVSSTSMYVQYLLKS